MPTTPEFGTEAPVVLITGASSGIGAAVAEAFAAGVPGVRLALVARRGVELERVAGRCRAAGAREVEGFICDVEEAEAVAGLREAVEVRWGSPRTVVNNAGAFESARFEDLTVEGFDRMWSANLRSAFLVTKAFWPGWRQAGRGEVIFIGSVAGLTAFEGGAAYGAAKAGLTALARVLRRETLGTGLKVTCVHPGATDTAAWEGQGVERGRMMAAADVARAVLDLWRLPAGTVVEEVILRPSGGDL